MIDGKEGREEIVCFATELLGWEEVNFTSPISSLENIQTQEKAKLIIHPNEGDEYIILTVEGNEVFKGTLIKLQDI